LWQGFKQNYETFKVISKDHKPLKWFLITVVLAEAGTTPLVPIIITVVSQVWAYDAGVTGMLFFVALLGTIPGVIVATFLCKRHNAQLSLRIDLLLLAAGTLIASFVMEATKRSKDDITASSDKNENPTYIGFCFSAMWGVLVGWFYYTEQVYFAASLPPKQETELSGFYCYCTIILTWVPTLAGSVMLEAGVSASYLLLPLVGFQFLSFITACCCPHWEDVLASAKHPLQLSTLPMSDPSERATATDEENIVVPTNNGGAEGEASTLTLEGSEEGNENENGGRHHRHPHSQ
jgi:MFS family permease